MPGSSPGMTVERWCPLAKPSHRQPILLRQFLQRGLRPRADVLNDFCRGERPQPPGVFVAGAAHQPEQKSGGKQIAGAGGVHHRTNRNAGTAVTPSADASCTAGNSAARKAKLGMVVGSSAGVGDDADFEMHARHLESVSFFRSSLIRDCQPSPWAR
jgi:hypothetical protein